MPTIMCIQCHSRPTNSASQLCKGCDAFVKPVLERQDAVASIELSELADLKKELEDQQQAFTLYLDTSTKAQDMLTAQVQELQYTIEVRDQRITELSAAHAKYVEQAEVSIEKKKVSSTPCLPEEAEPRQDNLAANAKEPSPTPSSKTSSKKSKKVKSRAPRSSD